VAVGVGSGVADADGAAAAALELPHPLKRSAASTAVEKDFFAFMSFSPPAVLADASPEEQTFLY